MQGPPKVNVASTGTPKVYSITEGPKFSIIFVWRRVKVRVLAIVLA